MAGIAPDDQDAGPSARTRRLRRALLAVHAADATSVAALIGTAVVTRTRPSGPAYAAIARATAASLLPGAAAVLRERSAHGRAPRTHRLGPTVLLLLAGAVIVTVGVIRALPEDPGLRRPRAVGLAYLAAGDLIDVPYLALVAALHRTRPVGRRDDVSGARRRAPRSRGPWRSRAPSAP